MVIHIAPIGIDIGHVIQWLKETPPVEKIWIIHSKKSPTINFPKIALDLKKKILSFYDDCEIKMKINEDPFGLDSTMDAIDDIIREEEDNDPALQRHEFLINVTGGTNAVAAGSIMAATLNGTTAHYVKNKKMEPGLKKYVIPLPIPSIGMMKMNQTYHKVLKIISEGYYSIQRYDGKRGKMLGPGIITNQQILKEMGWEKKIDNGKRVRQVGATNLKTILDRLKNLKYIEATMPVPVIKKVHVGRGVYEDQEVATGRNMYKITPLGRRQARNTQLVTSEKI
jgi:hypothetical protein